MRLLARQFIGVARLTALEAIRQPATLLLATAALFLVALLPVVVSHTLGESAKMIADSALAAHFFFGLLLGGFAACHSLSGEIRRGTAATVLSKPVPRELFFLAKFAGLAAVLLLFSAAVTGAGLLAVRAVAEPYRVDFRAEGPLLAAPFVAYLAAGAANYLTRRPFVSDAFLLLVLSVGVAFAAAGLVDAEGRWTPVFGAAYGWRFAPASALVAMAVLILAALALALATRLEVVPVVSICTVVFLAGLMSDFLLGHTAATNRWAAAAYALVPNWQHFWLADALHLEQPVPLRYLAEAALYAALYLLGVLGLGIVAFRHTEVKA